MVQICVRIRSRTGLRRLQEVWSIPAGCCRWAYRVDLLLNSFVTGPSLLTGSLLPSPQHTWIVPSDETEIASPGSPWTCSPVNSGSVQGPHNPSCTPLSSLKTAREPARGKGPSDTLQCSREVASSACPGDSYPNLSSSNGTPNVPWEEERRCLPWSRTGEMHIRAARTHYFWGLWNKSSR